MLYKKIPFVIEAFQYDGNLDKTENSCIPHWAIEAFENKTIYYDSNKLFIKTLEGDHLVNIGDYIIKGIRDDIYPCKPDIFKLTYMPYLKEIKKNKNFW